MICIDQTNVLTKALANGQYLRLDTTNDPLTGDLEIRKTAPIITFTDLGNAGLDEDWTIGTSGNDFIITNIDSDINGYLKLDHIINIRPNPRMPVPSFSSEEAMLHDPTITLTGGAVQGYFWLEDRPTVTINGAYNSYGIIAAEGICTCTSTTNLEATYLFVNHMTNTATIGQDPAVIHSFDSKPVLSAPTVLGNCPEIVALNDWTNVQTTSTGQITLDRWVTIRATAFDPFFYRLSSSGVGSSIVVTDRIGLEMGEMTKAGGGGTETIHNYYGFRFYPFTNGTTLACGGWLGKQTGAAANYGIVFDGDGIGCEARFGDGQDSAVYYDGTNLIIDPDIVGSGKVLIGITGDNDMLLNNIEIDGNLDHDGTNIGFFGTTPTTQQTALTTQLTDLSGDVTPTTPDYALTATNNGWGCGSQDEFETMTSVILNLQTRVQELETKLQNYGLLA